MNRLALIAALLLAACTQQPTAPPTNTAAPTNTVIYGTGSGMTPLPVPTPISSEIPFVPTPGINADNIVNNVGRFATYGPADVAEMKSLGLTTVRIPIDPAMVTAGLPITVPATKSASGSSTAATTTLSTATVASTNIARLDAALRLFTGAGMNVILCLQPQPPLIALPTAGSEDDILMATTLLVVHVVVDGYTPSQVAFEVLNEPQYTTAEWNTFLPQIVSAIRKIAPDYTIIVPPAGHDIPANFGALTPVNDPNVIYTFHMYAPPQLTMQGAGGGKPNPAYVFPAPAGSTDKTEWSTAQVVSYMQPAFAWAKQHNVPLIMTEFGASSASDPASRARWLTLVKTTAEANGVAWDYWAYDSRMFGLRLHAGGYDSALAGVLK